MSTYAIGDVQGCYDELVALLDHIDFDEAKDRLWFAGDLVNRGPKSREVLEFVMALGDCAVTVLGNHDIHLIACACIDRFEAGKKDTFDDVLNAPNCAELIAWLRHQALLHRDESLGFVMIHAGLPPQWGIAAAAGYAREVEQVLRGADYLEFLEHLYGNKPKRWHESLSGWDRVRLITNYLTRCRFLAEDGAIDFKHKGPPGSQGEGLVPWYERYPIDETNEAIVFGHWSALHLSIDEMRKQGLYAIDTGAVWGGKLSALRLEDQRLFQIDSNISLPIAD